VSILRKIRKERGLALIDVLVATRIREQTLSHIENRRCCVYSGYRKRLSDFFGVPESVLFDENNFAREADEE
jgi:transcriptional regulator with XRE-family HTH domain